VQTLSSFPRVACAMALCVAAAHSVVAQATIRDSAGVQIIETRLRGAPKSAFSVSDKPIADFGGESTDSLAEFFAPVAGAVRLRDGRIVVGLGAPAHALRLFDANGRYVSTLARRGQGPGELPFAPVGLTLLPGDTIVVLGSPRIVLFGPTGAGLGIEAYPRGGLNQAVFEGGGLLTMQRITAESLIVYRRIPRATRGVSADTGIRLATASMNSVGLDFRGSDGSRATFLHQRPFIPSLRIAVAGDNVIMGDGTTFEIREYDATAKLRRIIRRDADLTLRHAHIAAHRQGVFFPGMLPEVRQLHERWLAGVKFPKNVPAYSELRVDRTGRIWAREYPLAASAPTHWSVFGRDGAFLGTADTPNDLAIREIGADYILGTRRDADGFNHVRLYSVAPSR
jgi:hypothetical protein